MNADDDRVRDPGVPVEAFTDRVLVVCPGCAAAARVSRDADTEEARVTCASCGYARAAPSPVHTLGVPRDPWLGLELWLRTPCCGRTLWARNRDHLEFLADWVGARLRERVRASDEPPYRNRRMTSRLPAWMTEAGNREAVLRGLERLRKRAAAAE